MNRSFIDVSSDLVRRATEALFFEDYFGASIAVAAGVALHGIVQVLALAVPSYFTPVAALRVWHLIFLCLAGFGYKTYRARKPLPAKAMTLLQSVREARRDGLLTAEQAQQLTIRLLTRYVEDSILKHGSQRDISDDIAITTESKSKIQTP